MKSRGITLNYERFDQEYTILLNFLKKAGFQKAPTEPESMLYAQLLSYYLEMRIITSRLKEEINDFNAIKREFFHARSVKSEKSHIQRIAENLVYKHAEIMLDLSDFYIYTRIFLDNLVRSIKLYFRMIRVKHWSVMESSVRGLLSAKKMETYRKKIDHKFFEGLEQHVAWIKEFKKARDDLIHSRSQLVFATTREGKLGYEVVDPKEINWGRETVKDVFGGLQNIIDNLSDLMKYLHQNLSYINQ